MDNFSVFLRTQHEPFLTPYFSPRTFHLFLACLQPNNELFDCLFEKSESGGLGLWWLADKMKLMTKYQKMQFLKWPLEADSKSESIPVRAYVKMSKLNKNIYGLVQIMVLVSVPNFPLHDQLYGGGSSNSVA